MIKKITLDKNKKIFWLSLFLFTLLIFPNISFGDEGNVFWEVTEDFTAGTEWAYGVAVDPNFVYVAGHQDTKDLWRVEKRHINDGTIKWSVAEDFTPGSKEIQYLEEFHIEEIKEMMEKTPEKFAPTFIPMVKDFLKTIEKED